MKKKILIIIFAILCVISAVCAIYFPNSDINNAIDEAQNAVIEEIENEEESTDVIVSEEAQEIVEETIEATENGEDLSTTEIIESSEDEEETIEEEATEVDGTVEQENIAWEGTTTGDGLSLLGTYQGLTYYSQADSRWASAMYSSVNDSTQTMKSSACGPTSAAMVVSSSKGTILPTTMAELAVSNGYRTASNGTAWSYFSFVADYFDFEEFYTTYSFSTMTDYLTQTNSDGSSKYYVIASCGSGLFTTGGHYIVLVADTDNTITVYDPYLYSGKFDTASRKNAGVIVSGNSAYVTETAFKKYANYKCFWVFSNDQGEGNPNTITKSSNSSSSSSTFKSSTSATTASTVSYTRYVSTSSKNLNVRTGAGTNYSIKTSIAKGTKVKVTKVKGNWSYITSPVKGWVSTQYLSSSKVTTTSSSSSSSVKSSSSKSTSTSKSYTTGTYKVTASLLNVRNGASTSYSKKTYKQLTVNARKQNKSLGNYYANGYLKGVVCTVTQVKGNWGKTASGWICLDYCIKV